MSEISWKKLCKIGLIESTRFQQIWPFFVGIRLTWKKCLEFHEKIMQNKSSWVNPIPTNMTLFCWNRVDLEKINLDFWSTQFQQSQPDSNKVNPIPTKSTLFQQRPPQCQSTRFQQMGQPDSNNWVNPIPHSQKIYNFATNFPKIVWFLSYAVKFAWV